MMLDPRPRRGARRVRREPSPRAEDDGDDEMRMGGAPAPAPFTRGATSPVVCVEGPLAQRAWSCWLFEGDGCDAIGTRVQAALNDTGTRAWC